MCRLSSGYVLASREIRRRLAGDAITRDLYQTLMDWALIAQTEFHGTPVHRGNLITGYLDLSRELGVHPDTARKKLRKLRAMNLIKTSRVSNTAAIMITIINYEEIQNPSSYRRVLPNAASPQHAIPDQTLEPQGFQAPLVSPDAASPQHASSIINSDKRIKEREEREIRDYKPYSVEPSAAVFQAKALESPPSFLNSNLESESGSGNRSKIDKKAPPIASNPETKESCGTSPKVDLNASPAIPSQARPLREENIARIEDRQPPEAVAITKRWRDYALTVAKMTHFDFTTNIRAVKAMVERGISYKELGEVLDYLIAHPETKIAQEFFQPKAYLNLYFGKTLIDAALAEIRKEAAKPLSIKDQVKRQEEALKRLNENDIQATRKMSDNFWNEADKKTRNPSEKIRKTGISLREHLKVWDQEQKAS